MFRKKTPDETNLNEEIVRVLAEIQKLDPQSAQYTAASDNLNKLYKMKTESRSHRVKPETVVAGVVNLLGIGMIIGYERGHAITSKALSFIRPRT